MTADDKPARSPQICQEKYNDLYEACTTKRCRRKGRGVFQSRRQTTTVDTTIRFYTMEEVDEFFFQLVVIGIVVGSIYALSDSVCPYL
jgi:hypothetical protein